MLMFYQFPTTFLTDPTEGYDLVTRQWFPRFQISREYTLLNEEDEPYVLQVLSDLTGFMLYYQNCPPSDWTERRIEHCLMVDMPRSLVRDDETICAIPGILTSFFRFLGNSGLLSRGDEIAHTIEMNLDFFYEKMEDPDNYSMRKDLLLSAEDDGIDIEDETAVMTYFKEIGARELDEFDPEIVSGVNTLFSTWIVPFSDSRYVTACGDIEGGIVTEILVIFVGRMIEVGSDPYEWNGSELADTVQILLMAYPMAEEMREAFVPVIAAFFTFLDEEGLHPGAHEIVEAVRARDYQDIPAISADEMEEAAEKFLMYLMKAGVDPEDEDAVKEYLITHVEEILSDMLSSGDSAVKKLVSDLPFLKRPGNFSHSITEVDISTIPRERREKYQELITLTDQFCHERLDEDYALICRLVAAKLARKRDCPIIRGKISIWAAGIVYAVGQMNFLFDSSFEPHQSAEDICLFFHTSKSTTSQKAKMIRDLIGMTDHWDPEYSTSAMMERSPFRNLRIIRNGFTL